MRNALKIYEHILRNKTSYGFCFSETNILRLLYFLCFAQRKEDLWRIYVEAHGAQMCTQILSLCHLSPQIEHKVKVEKTPLNCNKKYSCGYS